MASMDEQEKDDVFGAPPKGKRAGAAPAVQKGEEFPNAHQFMRAFFYGSYVVPHPDRLDKKVEKRFRCSLIVPKALLAHNLNFHAHFKHTQRDVFRKKNPEFVRFKSIIFDYAVGMDGKELPDPRTFSLERLKQHCIDQDWKIDFDLFPGLELRDTVFQFFLRQDKKDESDAFYQKQEQRRRLHGLSAQMRAEMDVVPESVRIEFEEV